MAVSLVVAVLLLIGAVVFGIWAFQGRQDYKNNVDAKIKTAVAAAKQQQGKVDSAHYAEAAKNPLKTYNGPETYGSMIVKFPKTWSAYVDDTGTGSTLVDGYFAPGVVPSISDQNSVFALRVQVLSQSYAQTLQTFTSQQQSNKITVSAYALPKLPKVVGVKVVGQINSNTLSNAPNVTMIVLPLRSNTLEIWTEGNQYLNDFNNYILPNFSFSP